jgi:hypothetical protein
MFAQGKATTDPVLIKKWAEVRHASPAVVRRFTGDGTELILSFSFSDNGADEVVHSLSWEEFFEKFNQQRLVFVYDDNDLTQNANRYFTFY